LCKIHDERSHSRRYSAPGRRDAIDLIQLQKCS
jgi:hypothetical protein